MVIRPQDERTGRHQEKPLLGRNRNRPGRAAGRSWPHSPERKLDLQLKTDRPEGELEVMTQVEDGETDQQSTRGDDTDTG